MIWVDVTDKMRSPDVMCRLAKRRTPAIIRDPRNGQLHSVRLVTWRKDSNQVRVEGSGGVRWTVYKRDLLRVMVAEEVAQAWTK